jgi:hypothetical protein
MPIIIGAVVGALLIALGAFFVFGGSKDEPKESTPVKPVVIKEQPTKSKKGVPLDLQKKIYKAIGSEYRELQSTWKEEAEAKHPKPKDEDNFTGRDRRRNVSHFLATKEKNYRISQGREYKVNSTDIESILHAGFMNDWPK